MKKKIPNQISLRLTAINCIRTIKCNTKLDETLLRHQPSYGLFNEE